MRTLDRFAEALAEHDAFADPPQPGGNVRAAAERAGIDPNNGNAMLQRLRRDIGWQAQ